MTLIELVWQIVVASLGAVGFYVGHRVGETFFVGLLGAWVALAAWIALVVMLFGRGDVQRELPTPSDHSRIGTHHDRDKTDGRADQG